MKIVVDALLIAGQFVIVLLAIPAFLMGVLGLMYADGARRVVSGIGLLGVIYVLSLLIAANS